MLRRVLCQFQKMPSKPKVQLKDIGLDIGLAFAKHVYKTDYLHYGIWPEGLKVEPVSYTHLTLPTPPYV